MMRTLTPRRLEILAALARSPRTYKGRYHGGRFLASKQLEEFFAQQGLYTLGVVTPKGIRLLVAQALPVHESHFE